MDVFKAEVTPTTEPTQVNEQNVQESTPQESYLQKLVEAKGDNWKDPEVLAKGKLEADNFIVELKNELERLKQEVNKQDYAKELLSQLQEKATSTADVNPAVAQDNRSGSQQDDNTMSSVSEETLKSLVEKTLTEREQQNTVKQNLDLVNQRMEETYGTDAPATVYKKAQELGMDVERLKALAAESPTAFFTLIGEEQPRSSQPIVQGSVRTEGVNMQRNDERNFQYYQNLRRQNKALYYSPKIQQQMMADRQRLGDKFGL